MTVDLDSTMVTAACEPDLTRVIGEIESLVSEAWDCKDRLRKLVEMTNPRKRGQRLKVRLVVRRTRLVGHQAALWPDWRYHGDLPPVEAESEPVQRQRSLRDPTATASDIAVSPGARGLPERSALDHRRGHLPNHPH